MAFYTTGEGGGFRGGALRKTSFSALGVDPPPEVPFANPLCESRVLRLELRNGGGPSVSPDASEFNVRGDNLRER